MKLLIVSALFLISSMALAKTKPICAKSDQLKVMIAAIQERNGIECLTDQKYLICSSALGPAYLDLRWDRDTVIAEGYWSSNPQNPTVGWVTIEVRTKISGGSCRLEDYSFGAAIED